MYPAATKPPAAIHSNASPMRNVCRLSFATSALASSALSPPATTTGLSPSRRRTDAPLFGLSISEYSDKRLSPQRHLRKRDEHNFAGFWHWWLYEFWRDRVRFGRFVVGLGSVLATNLLVNVRHAPDALTNSVGDDSPVRKRCCHKAANFTRLATVPLPRVAKRTASWTGCFC